MTRESHRSPRQGSGTPPPAGVPDKIVEEAFQVRAALEGFDLEGFDAWLRTLPSGGAETELPERRGLAKKAFIADSQEGLLRHLEWMLLRWKHIGHSKRIRSHIGKAQREGGRKGAAASKATRNGPGSKKAAIIAAARTYQGSPQARIAHLARTNDSDQSYVRRVLRKAGL